MMSATEEPAKAKTEKQWWEVLQLPKWPALVVSGNPVSEEEALEIIIRTDGLYWIANDTRMTREMYKALGVGTDEHGWPISKDLNDLRKELKVLETVEYLGNHKIISSWIGGPHGWCDWNGTIGSNSYNIGKYPTVGGVLDEWQQIARAFPWLTLRSQLFSHESGEPEAVPLIEFYIHGGSAVIVDDPNPEKLATPTGPSHSAMLSVMTTPAAMRERGCTVEQLMNAIEVTRERVNKDMDGITVLGRLERDEEPN